MNYCPECSGILTKVKIESWSHKYKCDKCKLFYTYFYVDRMSGNHTDTIHVDEFKKGE